MKADKVKTKNNLSRPGSSSQFHRIWVELQAYLKDLLHQIIKPESKAIFLDFPVYTNIGDLMIYLGTEIWIKQHLLKVLGRWHINNFLFPKIDRDCTILLQGGGNFSDLYLHQSFRENVVDTYPENRIIFLPQSIYYSNNKKLKSSALRLSGHADLHILIRDHLSMKKAKQYLSESRLYLAPDMSVFLYPLEITLGLKKVKSKNGPLCLSRADIETAGQPHKHNEETWRGDWQNLLGWRIALIRSFQLLAKLYVPFSAQPYAKLWQKIATRLVHYCANRFNQSKLVTTSRLHGHILASLLLVENELYDNIYGKNSAYFETWHKDFSIARLMKY